VTYSIKKLEIKEEINKDYTTCNKRKLKAVLVENSAALFLHYINPLKPDGNYTYHLHSQSVTVNFVLMDFVLFSL
jgi:hypothetical protein